MNIALLQKEIAEPGGVRQTTPVFSITMPALLCCVLAISVGRDYQRLCRYSAALGVDGYYYVVQARSVATYNHLYYPSKTPFVFLVSGFVTRVLNDAEFSVKIVALVLHLFTLVGLYRLLRSCTFPQRYAVFSVAIAAFLPQHVYLLVEFIKQLSSICFLFWGLSFLADFLVHRHPFKIIAFLFCFALMSLSHSAGLALGICTLLVGVYAVVLSRRPVLIPVTISFAWLLIWILNVKALFEQQPLATAVLNASRSTASVTFFSVERLVLAVAGTAALSLIAIARTKLPPILVGLCGGTALISLALPSNPLLGLNSDVITGRIYILSYIMIGVLVPAISMLTKLTRIDALTWAYAPILWLLTILCIVGPVTVHGATEHFMNRRLQLINQLELLNGKIVRDHTLVVADHGDEFLVSAVLGLPSQHSWADRTPDRLYWLLTIPTDAQRVLMTGSTVLTSNGNRATILISESTLRSLWSSLSQGLQTQIVRLNTILEPAGYDILDQPVDMGSY